MLVLLAICDLSLLKELLEFARGFILIGSTLLFAFFVCICVAIRPVHILDLLVNGRRQVLYFVHDIENAVCTVLDEQGTNQGF